MSNRCTIIQGPPGTGKTHLSVHILRLWASTMGLTPLLATSDSNIAVDNIAEGLHRAGVKVIRVGRSERVRPELDEVMLDTLLEQDRRAKEAEQEDKAEDRDE